MSATPVISVELADGEVVEAEVTRSPRARMTRIQIGVDRPLRVIVPEDASDEFAIQALESKREWVRRKLRVVERQLANSGALGLERSDLVWDAGKPIALHEATVRFARRRDAVLEVPAEDSAGAIRRWYRRHARRYLRHLVEEESARLGCWPTRVTVRDQRTRWGSCSPGGTLSLNWRLLLMPEEIARYVVIHELVHLAIPNHSKAFWRTLGGACPDWRRASAWLREHGDELRQYEPPGHG